MKNTKLVVYHVHPGATGGWVVRREGATRYRKRFPAKPAAVAFAKSISGAVVVHRRDGTVHRFWSPT